MRANMQGTSRELSASVDCIASAIRVMRGRRRKTLQVFATRSFAYGFVRMLQPLYGLRVVALIATVAAPAAHAMTELASTLTRHRHGCRPLGAPTQPPGAASEHMTLSKSPESRTAITGHVTERNVPEHRNRLLRTITSLGFANFEGRLER